jgi:hypothetical protein
MAQISVTPRVFKNFVVRIADDPDTATATAADDYAPAVASCKFVPSSSSSTWKGGTEDSVFSDVTKATWTLQMRVGQDFENATSLLHFLFAHEGDTLALDFIPVDGGDTISAKVIIAAPELGGDIDSWGETSITHGVNGRPTLTAAS